MPDRTVYFAIPLAPKSAPNQWSRHSELLRLTIASLQNQTQRHYVALVCGHERPAWLDNELSNVEFIPALFKKPISAGEGRQDKQRKRRAIAAEIRRRGGGYVMYLDADDFVHKDLVGRVLEDDNGVGYLIDEGFVLDFESKRLARVPGVWAKRFDEICGSSGIIMFPPEELPSDSYPNPLNPELLFNRIKNHTQFADTVIRDGRKLQPIGFSAAIYTVNNAVNISNILVRSEDRQRQLIEKIKDKQILNIDGIRTDFGLQDFL